MEQLVDEVDVGEEHSAAAVSLEAQNVQRFSELGHPYPMSEFFSISSVNSFHLCAMTLPQEKHRTGMIIVVD